MATLSSKDKVKFTTKLQKLWESGRFKTRGDLATHLDVPYQQVQKALVGRLYKQGTVEQPDGNYRRKAIYGKDYLIYDDSRVWSVESNRLVGFIHKSGYKMIGVNNGVGKLENFRVSRLMLEVFVRKPKKGEWARHLDDDPSNNSLDNLAWGTAQDNADDCTRNGHRPSGESVHTAKLTEKVVRKLVREYKGEPYRTFAREFVERHSLDVGALAVIRILRGQTWTEVTKFKPRKAPNK